MVTSPRKIAMVTGVFFIITFAASIPGLIFYGPLLHNPNYIISSGHDTSIFWGAFLELITAFANIGTAVTLFSILKRYNEGFAIGYVASRIVESTIIVLGIISLLSIVTLRQTFAGVVGTDTKSLLMTSRMLVAIHDWTFLLGPALMAGVNGFLLGYLMYKSTLVPKVMTYLGLIGGPLLIASTIATLFGFYTQISPYSAIATIPIFFWELSLGIWLIVKGFNPNAATPGSA